MVALNGVTTLSWWGSLRVSVTPGAMSAGVWLGHPCRKGQRIETRQRVTPSSSRWGVGHRANDPAPLKH